MSQQLNPEGSSVQEDWAESPVPDFAAVRSLKRELLEELRAQSEEGRPVAPEDLLPRWPTDPRNDPDVASLLFEDFLQRRMRGEEPSAREYEERYPEHADSLAQLMENQAVLRSVGAPSDPSALTLALPAIGDELFHFRLRQELGRGAFARVFQAEQADLAGRPVVLKVSGIVGTEPQTLAQLQHTHIVPIYSVHEDARAGLRAVCMPYFGGASLAHVLQSLWAEGKPTPDNGTQLVEALAGVASHCESPNRPAEEGKEPPVLQCLRAFSYVQAAVWITARLAEGLQHAHQRGVLHRDIKPSNVLLGSDGQPMLLDFNLAQDLNSEQAKASATLGGTVAYMAPEHLRAMFSRDTALARLVDHRADIYSLGMVLYEMLTGQGPFQQSGSYSLLPVVIEAMALERSQNVPSVRHRRSDIPWSLESIICKCLAPEASQRYQQAEHLAEDLEAFLTDAPLRHAPELSRKEQFHKWARRHPRLTSSITVGAVAALLLIGAGAGILAIHQHLKHTSEELAVVNARHVKQEFEEGTVRAFCLLNTTTEQTEQATTGAQRTAHLREGIQVCEKTLGLYSILDRPDWQETPAWQRLDHDKRRWLAEDVRELLLLLAWARREAWQHDQAALSTARSWEDALRQSLELLDRAVMVPDLPESAALWRDRTYCFQMLGEAEEAQAAARRAGSIKPTSAHDHYLLAIALTRNRPGNDPIGRLQATRAAVKELDEAIRLNKKHYWSWLQRGLCHLELGEPAPAASDFGVCIGLWPEYAHGYFNRGIAFQRLGSMDRADADYTAALERDPDLSRAYLNRGLARLELLRNEDALADFDRAMERGYDEAALHVGRGVALERLSQGDEASEAFKKAWAREGGLPLETRLRMRRVYAFAIAKRLPEQARQTFQQIVQQDPRHVHAYYGLAMLAVEAKPPREREAIDFFGQALSVDPNFMPAGRFRAVLLARRGELAAALRDINHCLDREPRSGITLYAAACVAAQAVKHSPGPAAEIATQQALHFLRKAFAEGYGRDKAATDPDLAPIREHPEFKRLLQETSEGQ